MRIGRIGQILHAPLQATSRSGVTPVRVEPLAAPSQTPSRAALPSQYVQDDRLAELHKITASRNDFTALRLKLFQS